MMYRIDGIPVTPAEYQMLRFVITNEEQAGWKPTKQDISRLIMSGRKPSPQLKQDMKDFNRLMDVSYRENEN